MIGRKRKEGRFRKREKKSGGGEGQKRMCTSGCSSSQGVRRVHGFENKPISYILKKDIPRGLSCSAVPAFTLAGVVLLVTLIR